MNSRTAVLVVLVSVGVAMVVVSLSRVRLADAEAAAEAAEASFGQVKAEAERVLELRARAQTVAADVMPQQDVFHRLTASLAELGLPHVRVQSVSPAGDQALEASVGGMSRRIQTVRVVLEPITVDELGSFIQYWRREQALWIMTAIDLAVAGRGEPTGSYRATITAAALYLPSSHEVPQP